MATAPEPPTLATGDVWESDAARGTTSTGTGGGANTTWRGDSGGGARRRDNHVNATKKPKAKSMRPIRLRSAIRAPVGTTNVSASRRSDNRKKR